MQKYRYIEFIDRTSLTGHSKSGRIYYVGDVSDELIKELQLEEISTPQFHGYYSTLANISALGWELVFVTPCGINTGNHNKGPIENSYIFKKTYSEGND